MTFRSISMPAKPVICGLVLTVIMSFMFFPQIQVQAQAEIRIGAVKIMGEDSGGVSAAAVAGAVLAVEDINKNGGLLGQKLKIERHKAACHPQAAAKLAQKFKRRSLALVASHGCDRAARAAAAVYGHDGPIFISPLATHPSFTDENGYRIFRLAGRDDLEASVIALFLSQFYTGRRIAILYQDTPLHKHFASALRQQIRAMAVQEDLFKPLASKPEEVTKELRDQKIGVAVVSAGLEATAKLAKALRAAELTVQLIGRRHIGSDHFRQMAGAAAEGIILPQRLHPRDIPSARSLLPHLQNYSQHAAAAFVAAYAGIEAWAAAVRAAGRFEPAAVALKLHEIELATKAGKFRFDIKGDATLPPFAIYQWQGKQLSYLPPPSAHSCPRPPGRLKKLNPQAL